MLGKKYFPNRKKLFFKPILQLGEWKKFFFTTVVILAIILISRFVANQYGCSSSHAHAARTTDKTQKANFTFISLTVQTDFSYNCNFMAVIMESIPFGVGSSQIFKNHHFKNCSIFLNSWKLNFWTSIV